MNILEILLNFILPVLLLLFVATQYAGIFLVRYAKKYRWAVILYTCMTRLAPLSSTNYVSRSWVYLEMKEYERAVQDCNKALALKSEKPITYNNRGFAYFMLKKYPEALQDFNRAIELKSDFALAYRNRLNLHLSMKEYQRALQDADCAIALDPKVPGLYFKRGYIYFRLREYQRALQDFEHFLTLNPTNSFGYHNRGYMYIHLHDLDRGRMDLLKAIELHPTYLGHRWMIEFCNLCVEKPDLATAERLEKIASLEAQPDTAYLAYICRGVALWLRERYEEALIELEQSLLLESNSEDAYFWIAMVCASLERTAEARQALEHSLELGLPRVLLAPLRLLQEKHFVLLKDISTQISS